MSKLSVATEFQYTKVPTSEDKKDLDKDEVPETYGYGVRHVQLLILFLCVVMSFVARGHLGVTIVAMTNQVDDATDVEDITTAYPGNYRNYNDTIGSTDNMDITDYRAKTTDLQSFSNTSVKSNLTDEPRSLYSTFHWPKSIQELVLTSFFSGYCLMMMPISLVCQRWGGKVPLQMSMFINGVMSILTPTLAYWGGWKAVCGGRLAQGAAQAGTYPAVQTLLAQWVPAGEKSTLTSYVYTGATTGSVVGFQIGGMLSEVAGWPATFWSIGSLCILMGALLTVFGAASPRVHKTISEKEKKFIIGQTQTTTAKSSRAPWKALLTSKPLLANYSTAVGSGVAFVFFFTQVPSYIHYIYGIDVKNSGMLSSLPYIVSIFASVAFGIISDYLINHKIASRKNVRRYSNLISQVGMASALVGASYASNTTVAVVWFVVFMVSHMGVHTGWMINQIDLTPNYSGTMIAIANCMTNFMVMIMPFLIANIIVDLENVFQWRIMMFLEAGIVMVPAVIFAVCMSDDVQPWNDGNFTGAELKDMKLEGVEKNEELEKNVIT